MSESKDSLIYPHNALEAFGSGCLLDLRVRIAIQLLEHSPIFGNVTAQNEKVIAVGALVIATELMAEAERRGLVKPWPDSGELTSAERKQAKRTASFSALQQMEAQKFAQAEVGRVAVPQIKLNG